MSTNRKQISDYLFKRRQDLALDFQGLSHPDRLAILTLLLYKEQSFNYLKRHLKISKTALSNHLNNLIQQRSIKKIKRGVYRISEDYALLLESISQYLVDKRKREIQQLRLRHLQSFETINEVKVMNTESNTLIDTPKFQPSWITYAGSIAGVLQAFGEDYDVSDILGYSGYAFLSNVSRKSTHIAAPTATSFFEEFDEGISSLGYPFHGFWDEGAVFGKQGLDKYQINRLNKLLKLIKEQLDYNNPVILWGLAAAEFGIVTAYEGEELQVSTFRSYITEEDDTPVHYTELVSPGGLWAYYFGRKEFEPTETTDRDAIERALKVTKGDRGTATVGTPNDEWELEQMDYISGPEAFGRWAMNIESGDIDQKGNAYVLALYTEGRHAASKFFSRLSQKYSDRPYGANLGKLKDHYGEIYSLLNTFHNRFPFPQGNADEDALAEFSNALREVMKIETKSIQLLEDCLEEWK